MHSGRREVPIRSSHDVLQSPIPNPRGGRAGLSASPTFKEARSQQRAVRAVYRNYRIDRHLVSHRHIEVTLRSIRRRNEYRDLDIWGNTNVRRTRPTKTSRTASRPSDGRDRT